MNIPLNEIQIDASSYADFNGRVFQWNDKIFRGIFPAKKELYQELFQQGLVDDLISNYQFVPTKITDYHLPEFHLILQHKKVEQKSYCVEWPAPMLKEAALVTLHLNLKLLHHQLILQDAYPWNIYFEGCKPIFIDFSSIEKIDKKILWKPQEQFYSFFYFPLLLAEDKKEYIARKLLFNYCHGISREDLFPLLSLSFKWKHPLFSFENMVFNSLVKLMTWYPSLEGKMINASQKAHQRFCDEKTRIQFMSKLIRKIESISFPIRNKIWFDYDQHRIFQEKHVNKIQKVEIIDKILTQDKPKTLLDIGCNRGEFSILSAKKGIQVIAIDSDEACIADLYQQAKQQAYTILPLVIDFTNPTPAFGWNAEQFPSALVRLRSDMILALAVIHHWVFKQRQTFDRIVKTLHQLSQQTLLLEFVEFKDEMIQQWKPNNFEWYTLENLKITLEKYFSIIDVFDSDRPTRKLLLCRRKTVL